jgi:uncharacterized protein (DUF362 family)
MSDVSQVRFVDYESSIAKALDLIGAKDRLPQSGLVIIKPNLTNADKPPVTTDVGGAEAVYEYCRANSRAEIAIGEGCGSGVTQDTFEANGYAALAKKHGIRLIDFNQEPAITLKHADALQLREFHLPQAAQDAFVISLPVLKDHSFTKTTISMENMFGLAPAPYDRIAFDRRVIHNLAAPGPLWPLRKLVDNIGTGVRAGTARRCWGNMVTPTAA